MTQLRTLKDPLVKLHLPKKSSLTKGTEWFEGNSWALTPNGYALTFGILLIVRSILRYLTPGLPLGGDFALFKTAAQYVMQNNALGAYIPEYFAESARLFSPVLRDAYWYYPPHFFFVVAPLDWLPAVPALVLWISVSLIALFLAFRALLGTRSHAWHALTFSAVFMCADFGQTGCIIGAFVCWVLAWRSSRPIAAGFMLTLVACKPPFLPVLCLILLIERRWKTLIAACVFFAVIAAITAGVFGLHIWQAWWSQTDHAMQLVAQYRPSLSSIFNSMRGWGAPLWLSYGTHIAVLIGALAVAIRFYFQRPDPRLWNAAILTVICFTSPYFHVYDLALVGAAIVLVNNVLRERGWKLWEKEIITLTHLSPFFFFFVSLLIPLYLQPFWLLVFLKLIINETAPPRSSP